MHRPIKLRDFVTLYSKKGLGTVSVDDQFDDSWKERIEKKVMGL